MAATDLAGYYSGLGQALPSVSSRAATYQSSGLGDASTYAGTAAQNQALLNKLQASGGTASSGYSATPAATPTGSAGFSGTTSDPTLNGYISQYNDALNNQTTGTQAANATLQQQLAGLSTSDANSYTGAADYGNLVTAQQAANKIDNQLVASQDSQAATTPLAYQSAQGNNVTATQASTQASSNAVPYAAQVAQLGAALTPAENAVAADTNLVSGEAQGTVTGNALQAAGFTANNQATLAALQAKVDAGQALTNDEYNNYAQLNAAKVQAAATISAATQSAQIAANASTANTAATNKVNQQIAAQEYPGVTAKLNADGTYQGTSYLNGTAPAGATTPSGESLQTLQNSVASQIASNPTVITNTAAKNAAILQIMTQSGLSGTAAAQLLQNESARVQPYLPPPKQNNPTSPSSLGNGLLSIIGGGL